MTYDGRDLLSAQETLAGPIDTWHLLGRTWQETSRPKSDSKNEAFAACVESETVSLLTPATHSQDFPPNSSTPMTRREAAAQLGSSMFELDTKEIPMKHGGDETPRRSRPNPLNTPPSPAPVCGLVDGAGRERGQGGGHLPVLPDAPLPLCVGSAERPIK